MDMAIKAAGDTHPGRVRQNNEDAFFPSRANGAIDPAGPARNGQLFIVADGVGGNRGGARASEIAVSRLPAFFYGATNGDTAKMLRQAMDSTAHEIVTEAAAHPDRANMSCTIVAAVVKDGQATIAHMGDARAYLLRGGALRQLTRDDTWVQMQVDKGTLTEAEAAAHPERNVITKSMGSPSFPEPTVTQVPLEPGDRLLLCSDGLSGVATDAEIAAVLNKAGDPAAAVRPLIELANRKGGPDNITAVVVQIGQPAVAGGRRGSNTPLLLLLAVLAAGMVGGFFLFQPSNGDDATIVAGLTATEVLGTPVSTAGGGTTTSLAPGGPTSTLMPGVMPPGETPTATLTLEAAATASVTPTPSRTATATPVQPTLIRPGGSCPVGLPLDIGSDPNITFSWSYSGTNPPGEELQVWVSGGEDGSSGQFLTNPKERNGNNWTLRAPFSQFASAGVYEWRVSGTGVSSQPYCFRIEAPAETPTQESSGGSTGSAEPSATPPKAPTDPPPSPTAATVDD